MAWSGFSSLGKACIFNNCLFSFVAELKCEHAQRVAEMELVMQQKLREQQKVYEEAFNQDVEKYLSTGCLQGKGDFFFFTHLF